MRRLLLLPSAPAPAVVLTELFVEREEEEEEAKPQSAQLQEEA